MDSSDDSVTGDEGSPGDFTAHANKEKLIAKAVAMVARKSQIFNEVRYH